MTSRNLSVTVVELSPIQPELQCLELANSELEIHDAMIHGFTSPRDFQPRLKNLAHYKYQADGRQLLLAITLHHRTKPRVCNRCCKLLLSASGSRLADFCLLPRT